MAEATLPTEFQLDIVTPDRMAAHDAVTWVTFPGKDGYLGILPGHAPLLTELGAGELEYTSGNTKHSLAVDGGFAEVLPDRVILLVQTAERAEDIDVDRAEKARQRAEEQLKRFSDPDVDLQRAEEDLRRSIARLETAKKFRG
jgi:F-type H+-transporting ATPase subunit epsilon